MGSRKAGFYKIIGSDNRPRLADLDVNLITDGDSITQGANNCTTAAERYPETLAGLLAPLCKSLQFKNIGVGGQTTKNMLQGTFEDASLEVVGGKTNILFCMESVNAILNYFTKGDEFGAATGQINYDDFLLYHAKMKAAGYDYIFHLVDYYPRLKGGIYNNPVEWTEDRLLEQESYFNLTVNAFNLNLLQVDQVVDLRNHPILGGGRGLNYNPLYWQDSVHLVCDGYKELGGQWTFDQTIGKTFNLT